MTVKNGLVGSVGGCTRKTLAMTAITSKCVISARLTDVQMQYVIAGTASLRNVSTALCAKKHALRSVNYVKTFGSVKTATRPSVMTARSITLSIRALSGLAIYAALLIPPSDFFLDLL